MVDPYLVDAYLEDTLDRVDRRYNKKEKQKCLGNIMCSCQRYKCLGRTTSINSYVRGIKGVQ